MATAPCSLAVYIYYPGIVKYSKKNKINYGLLKTVLDCGKSSPTKLIYKGKETVSGDSPWHVAIYNTEQKPFLLICGGTIISQLLVVSGDFS